MVLIQYLTQIHLDFGAMSLLKSECRRLEISSPLLVSDAGVKALGIVDTALAFLEGLPHALFAQTPSNPTEAAVRQGAAVYQSRSCDGVIAVGGGSSIDCAKGLALAVSHEGPLKNYATVEGGAPRITNAIPPIIAVPTTSGTGSEVGRGALLIVDDGRKLGFHSWNLLPKSAICDPELTLGLPPKLTAATGMDAIAHCIETFLSAAFNPPADGIALDGLRRGWEYIERATKDGSDREARLNLMSASIEGALAFQKGLGCVHSLSHSLGGLEPRLHHGTLNAIFLPAVVRFNADADSVKREKRVARIAASMGLTSADDVPAAIADMSHRLGLPKGLGELGVSPSKFGAIIHGAIGDHCHETNPREAGPDDYRELLVASWLRRGRLSRFLPSL